MSQEFIQPYFIDGSDADEIQARMMENLPDGIDDMPGGFPYDFTMPTAIEKQDLIQYHIVETLQLMFPDWAWESWLDLHAKAAGIERRPAVKATGTLRIYGDVGAEIPAGTVFCTEATESVPSVEFATDTLANVGADGYVDVDITAVEAGSSGNVNPNTIIFCTTSLTGVNSSTNQSALTGGIDVESDDSLRERISLENAQNGTSYTANDSDLIRWAKEVTGVGDVIVVPTWNGPGTIKLVLVDSNGQPASSTIVQAVYDHLVSPSDRSKRLLPTGTGLLTVVPADTLNISYVCTGLVFDNTTSLAQIEATFREMAAAEYSEAKDTGTLYYNQMRGHITEIPGVIDFDTFTMNGDDENITLGTEEYPATYSVSFSS